MNTNKSQSKSELVSVWLSGKVKKRVWIIIRIRIRVSERVGLGVLM